MRAAVPVVLGAVVLVAGCSGPAPTPAPSPSAIDLQTVAACGPDVVVPDDSFRVEPSADKPPTITLRTGAAVRFAVPAGARVGVIASTNAGDDAQVCSATPPTAGSLVYVGIAAGYVRIGIQTGIESPLRVFVKVTA